MADRDFARARYVRDVHALAAEARRRLSMGLAVEAVARSIVDARNVSKQRYRAGDPPELVERRNMRRYGHPVGPDADQLSQKYGSWELVIAPAGRPAGDDALE